jgi:hypothetical protein
VLSYYEVLAMESRTRSGRSDICRIAVSSNLGRWWTAGAPSRAFPRIIGTALGQGHRVAVALERPESCGNEMCWRFAHPERAVTLEFWKEKSQ